MNRPSAHWICALWLGCLALALHGCGSLGKGRGAAAAEETAAAEADLSSGGGAAADQQDAKPSDGAPEEIKDGDKAKKDASVRKEEDKKEPAAEPAPDPAAAEEFKGLPKGEAEFILAVRGLAAGGKATMTGKDGFVFDTQELAALATNSRAGTARHQAMVAAVVAKAELLRSAGIELVVAPVPPKSIVYPDFLGVDPPLKDRRYDSYLQALYAELGKAGVRVVDATKPLRSNRFDRHAATFPKSGLLWSPAAASTTARAVHAAVRRTPAAKAITRDTTIVGRDSALNQNGDSFKARSVGWAQGDRLVPATFGKDGAPILVIGDEHAAAHRSDSVHASLADQLSLAFGAAAETRSSPGLGWKEAAAITPAADSATKVVVWCFSAALWFDPPAAAKKPATAPSRRAPSRPTRSDEWAPPAGVRPGTGLRLRDDPGLEPRSE